MLWSVWAFYITCTRMYEKHIRTGTRVFIYDCTRQKDPNMAQRVVKFVIILKIIVVYCCIVLFKVEIRTNN